MTPFYRAKPAFALGQVQRLARRHSLIRGIITRRGWFQFIIHILHQTPPFTERFAFRRPPSGELLAEAEPLR